ncbi:MAG: PAS domain-containing protein [Gammaproteobacteria bacterium]|nr:MAG: PAS domain-containing protein [Gammaproteobacteria bacterium]
MDTSTVRRSIGGSPGRGMVTEAAPPALRETAWRALRYFNLYRIIVAALFLLLAVSGVLPPPLGSYDPRTFTFAAALFFLLAVGSQLMLEYRWLRYDLSTFVVIGGDVLCITLLMYASGGLASGFGLLMVISIAAAGMLSRERQAFFYAALAALAVLIEESWFWLYDFFPVSNYTRAGLLGAAFFITAFLGHSMARRIRESEALAARRSSDLRNLSALHTHIIQRMQSGVLVLDPDGRIRMANLSAMHLLGLEPDATGRPLEEVVPELARELARWRAEGEGTTRLVTPAGGLEVWASFTSLQTEGGQETLIFLEDAAAMRQRAQQLKLASLGRLAASIAHEVRNPLGAISHAGQLLGESQELPPGDRRLVEIILEHARRVNGIVNNVLQVSRRQPSVPEMLRLGQWLQGFCQEFRERHSLAEGDLVVEGSDVMARMDPGQLHQVLWNLSENALRHSRERPLIRYRTGMIEGAQRPFLDVIDSGEGMSDEVREHLFEPFFSRDHGGSGLGLYLARELCECNQAQLVLEEHGPRGCRFRILFSHPEREQWGRP